MAFLAPILATTGVLNRKDLDPKQVDLSNNMLEAKGQAGQAIDSNAAALQNLQATANAGEQSNVLNQQQALAQMLQARAEGKAPSLANQQLANATGQNVANQAALMAGQRGAGANAGLMARQAAQQGANIQQQAAGQGAALRLQEQQNAFGQLQGQQSMMGNTAQGIQASRAQAQQGFQGNQNSLLGNMQGNNQLLLQQQQGINSLNRDAQKQDSDQKFQGIMKGVSALGGALSGGMGGGKAMGGEITAADGYKGTSALGRMMHGYAQGGNIMTKDGNVPGTPVIKTQGDTLANDTVKALLTPGEFVVKRSVAQSKDPRIMKLMEALKALHGEK